MKLRAQLLLATALVAALPIAGLQFVRQVERLLRTGQEQALVTTARALVGALAGEGSWPRVEAQALYVHRADTPLYLDGYGDDWAPWLDRVERLASNRRSEGEVHHVPDEDWPLQLALAETSAGLHLWLSAYDPETRFAPDPDRPGDELRLALRRAQGAGVETVAIVPLAPGRFTRTGAAGTVVHGDWQVLATGWSLELRIPPRDRPQALAVEWLDRDRPGVDGDAARRIGSGGLRSLVQRDAALERQLGALLPSGVRGWLVDGDGQVLAAAIAPQALAARGSSVSNRPAPAGFWQGLLFRRIVGDADVLQPDRGDATTRLRGAEIDRARRDGEGADWLLRSGVDRGMIRLRVAVGNESDDDGHGGALLVLERDADAHMLLANEAVLRLVGASLLSFVIAAGALLLFVLRLSQRIRRLQRAADAAVASDGRVVGRVEAEQGADEVADLSRSVAELLDRLREQQNYLRSLSQKLAHELRTPLVMIGSSLDNLGMQLRELPDPESGMTWLERASQGQRRLQAMLQAMSEASRLEESLIDEALVPMDPAALAREYVESRRASIDRCHGVRLKLELPEAPVRLQASADLLAQLLDKLIDNALDYTPPAGTIALRLRRDGSEIVLEVDNEGVPIEGGDALFEPMVSKRDCLERRQRPDDDAQERPHLGLGLFIARLIAQRHRGRIEAIPLTGGTRIRLRFPSA